MSILNKKYITTMSDGSKWAVTVLAIAQHRAECYADRFDSFMQSLDEDTIPLFEGNEDEVEDWARNNMDWADVKDVAVCVSPPDCDYEDGWANGEHELTTNQPK